MDNELIVKSIKNLCKKNNITANQLESEIGLSQGLISRWLKTTPSLDKIIDIANYFHVSIDDVVGYDKNKIKNNFVEILYDKTISKEIQWHAFDSHAEENGIKKYTENSDDEIFSSETDFINNYELHKEALYYFEYMNGYISIYAMYEHHDITEPKKIKLFIQPDIQAQLIEQSFNKMELISLWFEVLISLKENDSDEIKAATLKNAFINEFKKISKNNVNDKNFRDAKLFSSDFCNANLSFSDFTKADLRGANFNGANLSEANFNGAILKKAKLDNVIMSEGCQVIQFEEM